MAEKKSKDMTYAKISSLLKLAMEMQGRAMSLDEIAQEYNVCRRTAERMRDALFYTFQNEFEEVKNYGDRIKRWKINSNSIKAMVNFKAEHIKALNSAKNALKATGMDHDHEVLKEVISQIEVIREKKAKIDTDAEALMASEGIAFRPRPVIKIDGKILSTIRNCILECNKVKITYRKEGKLKEYTVMPYAFLYSDRNSYLVAKAENRDKYLTFMLLKIESAKDTNEYFEMDENFNLKEYSSKSFGVFQEDPFDVEWKFNEKVADYVSNFVFHPNQEMIKNEDGTLSVKFKAGGVLEMAWYLATWGRTVEVVQPSDFWERAEKAEDEYFDKLEKGF
ncbi:MAG: WYL domain-containing protein [Alphaproteobacteria bacterium]|nr:WYL domain-containing protein [Alphaproteobacteria bacterium]